MLKTGFQDLNLLVNLNFGVITSMDMASVIQFKIGDHVSWNSEAGRVTGKIIKVHTSDFNFKGYTHHCTSAAPQYEIKSDKTDHIAAHKGTALKKI